MERWLLMRLAERLGIAANLRFVRLEQFVAEQLEARGAPPVLDAARLEARLLAILLDRAALALDPELEAVRAYLSAAGEDDEAFDRRVVQLAARLADLYREYGWSRSAMLDAWSRGGLALEGTAFEATERWQRALWRAAIARGPERPLAQALRALGDAPATDGEPVHVFGLSYVARAFHEAFAALASCLELCVYALNPCQEFWEDARSDAESRRARRARAARPTAPQDAQIDADEQDAQIDADEQDAQIDADDSALLRAWGRPGREHLARLDELTGYDAITAFEDPGEASLLARLQASLLRRAPLSPGPLDASVRVLACPSIRREVETVAAEIWSLLERAARTGRPYRFSDVAVLLHGSDRDRYLPHIEAVFREAHDLPWNGMDLALVARSRAADLALRLVDLPGSSFTRAELLEVITHPLVLARWPQADPQRVAALCDRLGVFHGIDAHDHRGTYLEGADLVHWDQALRRLALGAFLEGERSARGETFGPMRLLPEPIDGSDEVATGLGLLVRSLASDARFARGARMPPGRWARFFAQMLQAYVVPTDAAEESDLRRCRDALEALEARDAGVPVSYRVAAELARRELASLSASHGEPLGDGVVVASLLPMRAIPFRAIFVLGLGEGRFPTRELDTGLDLRAARRAPGDVSIDERDRYTFLETLLSARECLVLSYVARDETSGEARGPSSIVLTIEEAIGAPLPRTSPPLRRHDALLGAAALDPIAACALPAAVEEARARLRGAAYRHAHAEARLPEAGLAALPDEWRAQLGLAAAPPAPEARRMRLERVSIEQIHRFLRCPIQGHAGAAIGLDVDDPDASATDEPFEPSPRERETLLAEVFAASLGADDEALARAYEERIARRAARGRWPLGAIASLHRERDLAMLTSWRAAFARCGPATSLHRVRFGGGHELPDAVADRPQPPLVLTVGGERVQIVGRTRWLLPNGDGIAVKSRSLEGDGERARVGRLELALRAFLDHALLSLAASEAQAPRARRAWILDGAAQRGPIAITFAPMKAEAAERWLTNLVEDLQHGPRGLFLPCEAALSVEGVLRRGSDRLAEALAAAIERVRGAPWEGGSSGWGPVRDAVLYPAPEPTRALAIVRRRFGAFFDHLREVGRQA